MAYLRLVLADIAMHAVRTMPGGQEFLQQDEQENTAQLFQDHVDSAWPTLQQTGRDPLL